ncbi:MAG TPA: hypothetical protein VNL96_10200 [Gemmatimonadaceae bacterium]|nr:hypothetical protein [Gemmatimonadaceae bacterium]
MASTRAGHASMGLIDSLGVVRTLYQLDAQGPRLTFFEDGGHLRLMELSGGTRRMIRGARIQLTSTDSAPARIDMAHAHQRGGEIGIAVGMDGSTRVQLSVAPQTRNGFSSERMVMALDSEGVPSVTLRHGLTTVSATGAIALPSDRLRLTLSPTGAPSVYLFDDSARVRLVLGHARLRSVETGRIEEERGPGSLLVLNSQGRVQWSAP